MSHDVLEQSSSSDVAGRYVRFWLGWSIVHGQAHPVESIVDDDPDWGVERRIWHHVLRLHVHHGPLASAVRWVSDRLPLSVRRYIETWFPGPFLPPTIIIKMMKTDWEEEFDTEIKMYERLKPIQGLVVPVFYGETTVDASRAIVMSDVGGKQLLAISYSEYSREKLQDMLLTALRAIYGLGISPYDANLLNCHVVDGRVVIVDHEQDEDIDEDFRDRLDDIIEGKAESIIRRHWEVHKPKKRRDPVADREANEAWKARYRHMLPRVPRMNL